MEITIKINGEKLRIKLNEVSAKEALLKMLPLETRPLFWGEEIYFYIKEKLPYKQSELKEVVELGDFAYWPEGPALCLFLGKTPISKEDKIKPASGVFILGKIKLPQDFTFKKISNANKLILLKD